MFGYIKAYKPDLTFSQYDIYKGVYCSLCKQIGCRYGFIARMTLSYDFAFFALVRLSVEAECPEFKNSRCSFNPFKKCLECKNDDKNLQLTADLSMLMVYYKYIDNVNDSTGVRKFFYKLLSPYFKNLRKKAAKYVPEADEILMSMHNSQSEIENDYDGNIDKACHPSADALGKLMSLYKTEEDAQNLYRFGYLIGRWVYLIDALDDYEADKKCGSFNPFIADDNFTTKRALSSLDLTAAKATEVFSELKTFRYKKIIQNILYDGLHISAMSVTKGEK